MKESKSNWAIVTDMIGEEKALQFGRYASYWFHRTPRRILHCLSYYKFASKLIGKNQRVLDIGCNEGLGTYLLSKECGYADGIDFDEEAIAIAEKNFSGDKISFRVCDILNSQSGERQYNAIVSFDVIEHIYEEHIDQFWCAIKNRLLPQGIAIIGTPSLISQDFASEVSKKGHVNIYSHERLECEIKNHFDFSFLFAANDEMVHTGYLPLAHYYIIVGCKKRN